MHYVVQDFAHKTLGTRLVPTCGHAWDFMHNDFMQGENFICSLENVRMPTICHLEACNDAWLARLGCRHSQMCKITIAIQLRTGWDLKCQYHHNLYQNCGRQKLKLLWEDESWGTSSWSYHKQLNTYTPVTSKRDGTDCICILTGWTEPLKYNSSISPTYADHNVQSYCSSLHMWLCDVWDTRSMLHSLPKAE